MGGEACITETHTRSLESAQARLALLYAKQGRAQQFSTQAERDAFLNKEIKSTKTAQAAQAQRIKDLAAQVRAAQKDLEESTQRRVSHEAELAEMRESVQAILGELDALKKEEEQKVEQRKWVLKGDVRGIG